MMHQSVMAWAESVIEQHGLAGRSVLEVGSANVNGSLRTLFHGPYIGIDLRPVEGVDVVASGNKLPYDDGAFGVVVCTETLSHDPQFWLTIVEMYRVMARDGYLLLTVRGFGFGRNDSPCDYYRFTPEAVSSLLEGAGFRTIHIADDTEYSGVLAWAAK
jgi:SAM-dependent methyltransferase